MGCCPLTEFCQVQDSLYVQVLRSPVLAALLHALQQRASAKLCGVVHGMELRHFRRGRHLYLVARSSRWASEHILVLVDYVIGQTIIFLPCGLLWPPYVIGAIIFLPCDFYLSIVYLFSSPNLSGHRLDVYHTSTPGVALVRI